MPEDITYDYDGTTNQIVFYESLSDEEIETLLKVKQAKDINSIKNISVFFCVLSIISLISTLIILLI